MGKFKLSRNSLLTLRTRMRQRMVKALLDNVNKENNAQNGDKTKAAISQLNNKKINKVEDESESEDEYEKKIIENANRNTTNNTEATLSLVTDTHFLSFQQDRDLYTLLYSSVIFKWIKSERLIIITDSIKTGYRIELFLKNFKLNAVYLDPENPINTNVHYAAQFLKGIFPILITNTTYNYNSIISKFNSETANNSLKKLKSVQVSAKKNKNQTQKHISPEFSLEIIEESKHSPSIVFFDCTNPYLLEEVSCKENVKEIIHIIEKPNKQSFSEEYETISDMIKFTDFVYDEEQLSHLRYRCEDILLSIKKSDVEKIKLKKINMELLHSKALKNYFRDHPNEREQVVKTINDNSIKVFKPSVGYLPSYLVHENNKDNVVKNAIEESYFANKKKKASNALKIKYEKRQQERKEKRNKHKNEDNDYDIDDENDDEKKTKIKDGDIKDNNEDVNEEANDSQMEVEN